MILSLVVAASTNNAIGLNNQLLWNLPNDLKFFKNVTWAMPVAMGRKTFLALDYTPLNGRFNIVISRKNDFAANGATIVSSIEQAKAVALQYHYKELMILGGGEIYHQTIPIADKIYITRVQHVFENADAFFPVIDENRWHLASNEHYYKDEKHAYDYSFQLWVRK